MKRRDFIAGITQRQLHSRSAPVVRRPKFIELVFWRLYHEPTRKAAAIGGSQPADNKVGENNRLRTINHI
jgi:hypothetical protein